MTAELGNLRIGRASAGLCAVALLGSALLGSVLLGCERKAGPAGGAPATRAEAVLAPARESRAASPAAPPPDRGAPAGAATANGGPGQAPGRTGGVMCQPAASGKVPDLALEVRTARSTERARQHLFDGRPVFVNVWAAWCEPCKQELPLLLGFAGQLRTQLPGVDVAFLSLDDDERQLTRYLDQSGGLEETYYWPEGRERQEFLSALGLPESPRLPLQILVDGSGNVRCTIDGAIEPADLPALRKLLAEL